MQNGILLNIVWVAALFLEHWNQADKDANQRVQSRLILNKFERTSQLVDELCRNILWSRILIEDVDQKNECVTRHLLQLGRLQIVNKGSWKLKVAVKLFTHSVREVLVQFF